MQVLINNNYWRNRNYRKGNTGLSLDVALGAPITDLP